MAQNFEQCKKENVKSNTSCEHKKPIILKKLDFPLYGTNHTIDVDQYSIPDSIEVLEGPIQRLITYIIKHKWKFSFVLSLTFVIKRATYSLYSLASAYTTHASIHFEIILCEIIRMIT